MNHFKNVTLDILSSRYRQNELLLVTHLMEAEALFTRKVQPVRYVKKKWFYINHALGYGVAQSQKLHISAVGYF